MKRAGLLLLLAFAMSCAGKGQAPSQFVRSDARKDEIKMLWGQIREWRAEIHLRGVEPTSHMIQRYLHVSMHDLRQELANMCEQPTEPTDTCNDVCSIAENICENAEAICRIAGELDNDHWADQKCASAKASCKEAKQRCCDCEHKNGHD
jgi:hypothetical protein